MTQDIAIKRFASFADDCYKVVLGFGLSRSFNPMPEFGPYVDRPASSRMKMVETENGVEYVREEVTLGYNGMGDIGL